MADPRSDAAIGFMREAEEAESVNRVTAIEDLKFRFGQQWPAEMQNSRKIEARPMFTINETDSYCRQVVNSIRQMRPRGRAHPVGNGADVRTAKVITGIGRHVEMRSDAANAYDLAVEFAVTTGLGYFRMRTDWVSNTSRDQDIYIDQVENPFSVYRDPVSKLPDGSDQKRCLVTDIISNDQFDLQYPGAERQSFIEGGAGDSRQLDWVQKDAVRLAEYFTVDEKRAQIVFFRDGSHAWADSLPPPEVLAQSGLVVLGDRMSYKREIRWSKVSAWEELDHKIIPGDFIPVIPVYGVNLIIDGHRRIFGMVRFARDPQLLVNFWQTAITESLALAPKAKWLIPTGGDVGYENEYAQANNSARPALHYNSMDDAGQPLAPPERLQPEPPPAGLMEAAAIGSQSLQRVLGMFDPVNLKHTGPKSGEAIRQEMGQSEQSNYHFYDNLTRSINHAWRIMLGWMPVVYDTQRVMRIIGDDMQPDLVTINEQKDAQGATKVLNDVRVGDYDVIMETGPGYNTKRQEALVGFQQLLATPMGEEIAKVGADLVVRMYDFDGAQALADRLAAANPLAQIDEKIDIAPEIQLKMKAMEQQIQQMEKLLQDAHMELKYRGNIEGMKQAAETHRETIRQAGDKEEREVTRAQKQHDTETYALTAQNVAEINAMARLLTSKTEHGHRMREMLAEFQHNEQMQDKQLEAKSAETEATVQ